MNKRYRELEKKAIDARCTYEKVLEKSDKLVREISEVKIEFDELSNKEACVCIVLEWFKLREQVKNKQYQAVEMTEECKKANVLIDGMSEEIRKMVSEVENGIQLVTNKNDAPIKTIKSKTKQLQSRHKEIEVKNNKLQILAKKTKKMIQKVERINKFCENAEVTLDNFVEKIKCNSELLSQFEEIEEVCTYSIETKREIEKINNRMLKQDTELKQLQGKLAIAKDKMEEAEYQFKEYKNMVNIA